MGERVEDDREPEDLVGIVMRTGADRAEKARRLMILLGCQWHLSRTTAQIGEKSGDSAACGMSRLCLASQFFVVNFVVRAFLICARGVKRVSVCWRGHRTYF